MFEYVEWDVVVMTAVIFVPTLFALGLLLFPRRAEEGMRWWTLFGTAITMILSWWILIDYQREVLDFYNASGVRASTLEFRAGRADAARAKSAAEGTASKNWVGRYGWIPRFNIDYYLGVDGISLAMVVLTTALFFLSMIASWKIEKFLRGYLMLFLILETGVIGTFLSLDFFLFYIFWEVMLLPMYFLIGVWGGPRREYAAIKFFLYTLLGSVFILIALLGFYFTDVRDFHPNSNGGKAVNSFDLVLLQKVGRAAAEFQDGTPAKAEEVLKRLGNEQLQKDAANKDSKWMKDAVARMKEQWFFKPGFQITMFVLLFIGFAIKVPVFPFHTWLPDAHVEAPTPISMILAGILLKLGGYGIIRIAYPICPWAAYTLAYWVALIGIVNIVYGAFAAMAQTDFKKLVAYSSISHMGYVILGIAVWAGANQAQYWSWGMNGAMFQMVAHGITSAGMFFLVGVIYDRAHHRNLDNFRGLYEPMPLYGGISAIIFFAAMGLPGMCGFVGEFMVILSAWNFSPTLAILAALTVVITAAYILWTLQRVYFGQNPAYKDYPDINLRELACAVPIVVFSVLLGVNPNLVISWMEPSVTSLVETLASIGGMR